MKASPLVRRLIWAVAALLAIGAVGVAVLPYVAASQIVRDRIAFNMSLSSGYRVIIDAPPVIEIWPLRAIITDVSLSRWDDSPDTPVLEAERVEIDLSAFAALRGNIVFSGARLIRPVVYFEGEGNAVRPPPLPGGGSIARAIDVTRRLVEANPQQPDLSSLPNTPFGTVEFIDGRVVAGDEEVVKGLNARIDWPTLDKPANFNASGTWRGEASSIGIASAQPLLLLAGGAGPLSWSFKAQPAEASFEGRASVLGDPYFDGQLRFATPALRRLLEWSGSQVMPHRAIGALSVNAKASGNLQRMKMENTQIVLDGNPGLGALEIVLGPSTPALSGTLAFETLNLQTFLYALSPLTLSPADTAQQLPVRVDVDLRLSSATATAGSLTLANVAATAQVRNELAVFDISDASAFGGSVQAGLRFDRGDGGTQVELRLMANDIDGGAFGQAVGMSKVAPVSRGNISLTMKGEAHDWQSLMQNADGSISANFGQGTLSGFDLGGFQNRLKEGGFFALADVSQNNLPIDGMEVRAALNDGVARLEKAEARSGGNRLWLSGIVPYIGRGLALTGGIEPIQPPAPPPAAPPAAQAEGQAPTANVQTQPTTPAAPPPRVASFFVGGSWDSPFISPLTSRSESGAE
ncbi:AsmA family protein [Oryzicola mucosus]|uniref:AsmA family protein n=1 Tax=Oryzicola mucosus TaxID=2767425 RepID=A0A8J6U3N0_9HYPH|nr:AsmA-like C-terminal region-containing protein [Oryzicola mucosus]MBD0413080.1 AsmA family protein [Oryzicola mucosus]